MGNQGLQKVGEDAAAALLQADGWRLLHRNWRRKVGELDLVAVKGDTLAFVEVKARRAPSLVDPALGVDERKQRQLRRVASLYLAFERPRFVDCRFDVISVLVGDDGLTSTHWPSAF